MLKRQIAKGETMTEEWAGQIDGAEIHDHVLTPEQIAQMTKMTYRDRVIALEPVAYWPMPDPLVDMQRLQADFGPGGGGRC